MPQKVYLDDHGEPIATAKVYLNDAGDPVTPKADEGKSVGGFLSNAVTSGGQFLSDIAGSVPLLAKAGMQGARLLAGKPDYATLGAVGETALKVPAALAKDYAEHYGSLAQAGKTAYEDPFRVLADLSTVAGGVGLGAKASGASRIARLADATSEATNPMRLVGAVAQPVGRAMGRGAVRMTLRPPAAVREDFGGSKAIANAVLDEGVFSEAGATNKLDRSVAKADHLLTEAQAAGTPGVSRVDVARSVLQEPKAKAKLRTRLGVPDATPALTDQAKAIFKNNPREIRLTDAQAMKREAQDLAYEAGADNNSIGKAAEKAKAQALRAGIEQRVPAVAPINEQSQRLLGTKLAFQNAEDRPRALTNFLSALGGIGGFAGGGPAGATVAPLLIKALDSPRAGALTGLAMDRFGQGLNAESLRKAALVARLLQDVPE